MSTRASTNPYLAPILVVLLLGCGGNEPTQHQPSNLFVGTTDTGAPFTSVFGEDVEMPQDFPSDFHRYPGARAIATVATVGQGMMVTLQTDDDPAKVFDSYARTLPQGGWQAARLSNAIVPGVLALTATKGEERAFVYVVQTEEGTQIMVTLVPRTPTVADPSPLRVTDSPTVGRHVPPEPDWVASRRAHPGVANLRRAGSPSAVGLRGRRPSEAASSSPR